MINAKVAGSTPVLTRYIYFFGLFFPPVFLLPCGLFFGFLLPFGIGGLLSVERLSLCSFLSCSWFFALLNKFQLLDLFPSVALWLKKFVNLLGV